MKLITVQADPAGQLPSSSSTAAQISALFVRNGFTTQARARGGPGEEI